MVARAGASSGSAWPSAPRRGPAAVQRRVVEALQHHAPGSATAARAFSAKDGFSVVAPTSVTVPSSTIGRKPSCWARLKRWISSTNSSVPLAAALPARAPPRRRLAARRRRRSPPRAAEAQPRRFAPAAARWWSCRRPAGPRGSARRACPPRASGRCCACSAQQVVLADHLGQRGGAQAIGQRARGVVRRGVGRGFAEQVGRGRRWLGHHAILRRAGRTIHGPPAIPQAA